MRKFDNFEEEDRLSINKINENPSNEVEEYTGNY